MDEDLVMIYTHGFIGWCGQPMVFGIMSRTLQQSIQPVIHGPGLIYVDDIVGFMHHSQGPQDVTNVRVMVSELLGQGCLSDKAIMAR